MLAHRLGHTKTLAQYWVTVFGVTPNVGQLHRWQANINPALVQSIVLAVTDSLKLGLNAAQQTRIIEPVLVCYWASVADSGPALDQHWVISSLLGVLTSVSHQNGIINLWLC